MVVRFKTDAVGGSVMRASIGSTVLGTAQLITGVLMASRLANGSAGGVKVDTKGAILD